MEHRYASLIHLHYRKWKKERYYALARTITIFISNCILYARPNQRKEHKKRHMAHKNCDLCWLHESKVYEFKNYILVLFFCATVWMAILFRAALKYPINNAILFRKSFIQIFWIYFATLIRLNWYSQSICGF